MGSSCFLGSLRGAVFLVCAASLRGFRDLLPDEQSLPGWDEGTLLRFQVRQEGPGSCPSVQGGAHLLHRGGGAGVGLCAGPELGEGAAQPLHGEVHLFQGCLGQGFSADLGKVCQGNLATCDMVHVLLLGADGAAALNLCSYSRSLGKLSAGKTPATG